MKKQREGARAGKKTWRIWLRRTGIALLALAVLGIGAVFAVDARVRAVGEELILTSEEAAQLEDVDCILVLGCLVWDNGQPSPMLRDRLNRGIELYDAEVAPKLLMSGDHGQLEYNEVGAMKEYALEAGISSEDVFMDHAGFSTYESIYRAKEIFGVDKMVIVTQEYHLYRALYVAKKLGIEAYGVTSDYHRYVGQEKRDAREVLARVKDFGFTVFKPEPTYLGDPISIAGSGDVTND